MSELYFCPPNTTEVVWFRSLEAVVFSIFRCLDHLMLTHRRKHYTHENMADVQQSQFLTVSLQFVASHRATPRLWEVATLLQVRGLGRPVCTETEGISVEAP